MQHKNSPLIGAKSVPDNNKRGSKMEIFVIKTNHMNGAVITTPYRADELHVALFDASQYNSPNVSFSAEVVFSE